MMPIVNALFIFLSEIFFFLLQSKTTVRLFFIPCHSTLLLWRLTCHRDQSLHLDGTTLNGDILDLSLSGTEDSGTSLSPEDSVIEICSDLFLASMAGIAELQAWKRRGESRFSSSQRV